MSEEKKYRWTIWVVYDHPDDFPEHFIAREYLVVDNGAILAETGNFVQSLTLDVVRETMVELGKACIHRSENDVPAIMETWI